MKQKIIKSLKQTLIGLWINLPIVFWILIFVVLLKHYVSIDLLSKIQNNFLSIFLFSIFGGISAGNPVNSYLIAWEFGNISDNIIVISAFLISWVTVWFVQIPAESYFFWKKFAIFRNILAFIFSLLWAYIIFLLYKLF
jgi:hypothetical protein